jgi:hypothetical protein
LREHVSGRYELEPVVLADAITSALNEAMQEDIDAGPNPSELTAIESVDPAKDLGLLIKNLQSGVIFRFEQHFSKLASLPPVPSSAPYTIAVLKGCHRLQGH